MLKNSSTGLDNFAILKWGFCLFVSFWVFVASAQNTRGDRPVSNQQQIKESKARLKSQRRAERSSSRISNQIQTPKGSPSSKPNNVFPAPDVYSGRKFRNTDRAAKPLGPIANTPSNNRGDKAWKGYDNGTLIRANARKSEKARSRRNVFPQPTEYKTYLSKKKKKKEHSWKGDIQGAEIVKNYPRSQEKAYKGSLDYGGPSKKEIAKKLRRQPKAKLTTASGEYPIRVYPRTSEQFQSTQPANGSPPSIPPSFIKRGKKNVYWGKVRKKEKPFLKDIAGLTLRRRNYRSTLPPLIPQDIPVSQSRPSKANLSGGEGLSNKTKRDNAWLGDLSRSKLRKLKFKNTQVLGSSQYAVEPPGQPKTGNGKLGYLKIPPAIGAAFAGKIKVHGRKPFSTESYSFRGNLKSNKYSKDFDESINYSGFIKQKNARVPYSYQGADFSGNTRGFKKPLKGGGSVSGMLKNNKNKSVTDKYTIGHDISHSYAGFIKGRYARPSYGTQGADFSGRIKAKKPEKGGGSISGRLWNNYGESLTRERKHAYQGYDFSGVIKARKPEIGGETVSGQLWNNKEKSITRKRNHAYQGYDFAGVTKAIKPKVGAESISGQLWNNHEKPIPGTYANRPRQSVATSGKIQLSKFKKDYIQNPRVNAASMLKRRPHASTYAINTFKAKMRQADYKVKPKASELALRGIGPGKNVIRASSFGGKVKMTREYVHNPKSAMLALKVLSQPKASAKIGDYQGNKKMRKPLGKNLHPDAQFAHLKENNVKEQRTFLTNVKLTWAKMFKKNQNQPTAAKPNEHPLRYDRKEKELWKALYDYNDRKK